jgi:two-component system sensor histidine kinase KdpD
VFEGAQIGTLVLSAALSPDDRERVAERIVPALESILGAALHRASLQAEVVETAALRRSDETKTAVLRSVSHDLRTPVTAILTAAAALDARRPESVGDVKEVLTASAGRLWRLIEKLLDLSLLQAGAIEPRLDWYSIEEVLQEAVDQVHADRDTFKLSLGPDIPLLRGDPGQLERGFANVLENAARHSGGRPVSVRARSVGDRIRVRIVDQGPGIPRSEQERIFMPFYRSPDANDRHQGSGLGLAIAKGFVELNGGRIAVESLPGQGTTFVIDFATPDPAAEALVAAPLSMAER